MRRGLIGLLLSLAGPALASDFVLSQPIDCVLGETCHIQQFVDHDPGAGARDFTCGGLSYDTHKGTDFALPTLADMARGVPVLAAAPGTVRAIRDGMPDVGYTDASAAAIEGRECGNGMVIDHADGWQTQYCHLRRGSVAVRRGDTVARGEMLGLVGLSGRTQFPHVHITVRHNGAVVDPFATAGAAACASHGELWEPDIAYVPGGIVDVGLATGVPDYDAVKAGTAAITRLDRDMPALVVFGLGFGARVGDIVKLRINGPTGPVIEQEVAMDRTRAQIFQAAGRRARGAWPPGEYIGSVEIWRDGIRLGARETRLTLD